MIKRFSTLIVVIAILATANVFAATRVDTKGDDKTKTRVSTENKEKKDWKSIFNASKEKPFDPASSKSTLSEHQKQQKAAKKFSTTTKVLIGAGIAAAVVAVVFIVARKDLKDDIFR